MFNLDPIMLARIQFAFTVSFHIVFPAFTIGLASFLAMLEWRWLKTGNELFRELYKFWVKIFAVAFGMGVVSGVTMSYQFGTNWSIFSDRVANVLGPLLGYEVLTAFFLEASFLGIMLFGWGRESVSGFMPRYAARICFSTGIWIVLLPPVWVWHRRSKKQPNRCAADMVVICSSFSCACAVRSFSSAITFVESAGSFVTSARIVPEGIATSSAVSPTTSAEYG